MISDRRAREIAGNALGFVAADRDLTAALLDVSGMQADDLRHAAAQPEFALFMLDFILLDDQRVLAFAADQAISPESILYARDLLAHHGDADAAG